MAKSRKQQKSYEKKLVIQNKLGLHARPAALFVQTANRFKANIEVRKGRQKVNGKSIMGIMTLAVGMGSTITICATGEDASQAVSEIARLVTHNFGEKDGV